MKLNEITLNNIESDLDDLIKKASDQYDLLNEFFLSSEMKLEVKKFETYKCKLTKDIHDLLKFAKNEKTNYPAGEVCNKIINLFWRQLATNDISVSNWAVWSKSCVGLIVKAALVRISLNAGNEIYGPDVAILSSLSRDRIQKITVAGEIDGAYQRDDRTWIYPAKGALRFIESRNQI